MKVSYNKNTTSLEIKITETGDKTQEIFEILKEELNLYKDNSLYNILRFKIGIVHVAYVYLDKDNNIVMYMTTSLVYIDDLVLRLNNFMIKLNV